MVVRKINNIFANAIINDIISNDNPIMRKYPIGIQTFADIRNDGYLYIDKTHYVEQMIKSGKYYFLSRPRRFGKSLLISTLQSYFEGKRELFNGLHIDRDDMEWVERPVFKLDLNSAKYQDKEALVAVLSDHLDKWESEYGVGTKVKTLTQRFAGVLCCAHEKTGHRVAILVDEYDKPMLQVIDNPSLTEEFRDTLKAFYSVMKGSDEHIKFALLTGVTKFSKVSIFSDLNNIEDITLDDEYSAICGITGEEIRSDLDGDVAMLAEKNQISTEDCYEKLKEWYDGYHFTSDIKLPGVYNPFSLLNTLKKLKFQDYWFQTGTPMFLLKVLRNCHYRLDNLTKDHVTADLLGEVNSLEHTPLPLLYQSGYLTLTGYDDRFQEYTLDFPNEEVRTGFYRYLVNSYIYDEERSVKSPFYFGEFIRDIETGKAEQFLQRLNAFLADGDYQIAGDMELYFQNVMAIVFKMLGVYVQTERHTSNGRMDVVMQTSAYIYIIELKLDATAEEALQQIEEKQYAAPFAMDNRTIIKIGATFGSESRKMDEWKIQ